MTLTNTNIETTVGGRDNVLSFDARRARRKGPPSSRSETARQVVAVVTVTRFIGEGRVHAQVPVFADEILPEGVTREELKKLVPELSELLADGAVEANAYLDRFAATRCARPIGDFYSRRN
jgi:hypothetical protein